MANKKIYVGNLNYATTDEQLSDLFGQYGTVESANIIIDKYSNQSKGFGFVEMADDDSTAAAISALNGTELNSRELRVSEARPRQDRDSSY